MLIYNFDKVFKARSIERPFTFLLQAGFSNSFATKVKNNRVKRLSLDFLERLCFSLNCTPNDFTDWIPDKDQKVDKSHALYELKRTDKILDLTRTLNLMPLSKLEQIERLLEENK